MIELNWCTMGGEQGLYTFKKMDLCYEQYQSMMDDRYRKLMVTDHLGRVVLHWRNRVKQGHLFLNDKQC